MQFQLKVNLRQTYKSINTGIKINHFGYFMNFYEKEWHQITDRDIEKLAYKLIPTVIEHSINCKNNQALALDLAKIIAKAVITEGIVQQLFINNGFKIIKSQRLDQKGIDFIAVNDNYHINVQVKSNNCKHKHKQYLAIMKKFKNKGINIIVYYQHKGNIISIMGDILANTISHTRI